MASRRLRVVVDALDRFLERIVKKLVLDIVANLVKSPGEGGTPRDTGWAAANWVPNIGSPTTGTTGSQQRVSNSAQTEGVAAVATGYKLIKGPVHITNNVPYIVRLNEGSSQQAPAGFVQAAIATAVRVDLGAGLTL